MKKFQVNFQYSVTSIHHGSTEVEAEDSEQASAIFENSDEYDKLDDCTVTSVKRVSDIHPDQLPLPKFPMGKSSGKKDN